jgi:hypothetical protein
MKYPGYRDPAEALRELADARTRLNAYVRALHARREPLGMSAYRAHGELARAGRLKSRTRCPAPDPSRLDEASLRRVTEVLDRLPGCLAVLRDRDRHPWRGCRVRVFSLVLRQGLEYHIGRLANLAPEAADVVAALARLGLAAGRPDRGAWLSATDDARLLLGGPVVPPTWFEGDPRGVAAAVIELDAVTRLLRESLPRLPEFSRRAVRALEAAALDGLGGLPATPAIGLTGLADLGLREAATRLREAGG